MGLVYVIESGKNPQELFMGFCQLQKGAQRAFYSLTIVWSRYIMTFLRVAHVMVKVHRDLFIGCPRHGQGVSRSFYVLPTSWSRYITTFLLVVHAMVKVYHDLFRYFSPQNNTNK